MPLINHGPGPNQAPKDTDPLVDQGIPSPEEPSPQIYQKVKMDQRVLAGFFLRLVSYLIDLVLSNSLAQVFTSFLGSDGPLKTILSSLIFLAYFVLSTGLGHGQSLGKMILGLKVIKTNGESLTWTDILVREGACRYILKKIPLLYLLVLFTEEKQHLGDLICDTLVIKEAYEDDLFYKESYVYPNYQTSYIKNN